ncbi:uncharacterized protein Z519_10796 [Cladophialophora bantiana CBS 173.52]|uniref:Uncharacterized protein n=1 Tax=Cladophialophora bantiana (strain ATCC 10958 / CBS 173.52 / CDC B-1940 / NIH 8579) TaxID=1442370 RepID=A0A0D2HVY3_CLAB1|nr:uncharacterized protein Z519_10796 [Cladophialophora bantiana CBS 173.52]KIW88749.1 hypothetical protein Z519_10796 [Cladophialophora bantiana CBS 173.52]
MTIRKQYPPRSYETFPDDNDDSITQSPTSYQRGGDADKSRSAAAEAQRLGSQGSWADNFAGGTPATNRTPTASAVDGDEVRDLRYPPHLSSDGDPSDPPPVYTPSASTQVGSQSPAAPASPVAARPNLSPVPEPVSASATASCPSNPQSSPCPFRDNDEEEGPSSMSETVPHDHHSRHHDHHHYHHHHDHHQHEEDADSDSLPVFLQQHPRHKRTWCRTPGKARGCGGRGRGMRHCSRDKGRARRLKRTIFFLLALLACLWLLIPGFCRSLKNVLMFLLAQDGRYQLPSFGPHPSQAPWPPPKREHREHETFRSISGTYQLYDLLDLSTTAGSITVTVEVQPGDKPAVLRLSTTAGSVNVKMISGGGFFTKPTIPDAAKSRTLVTEISTGAGSVSGNVVHGNGGSTSIATNAGSISLTIYAVGVSEMDPQSNISTISNQGSQHIKVVPSLGSTEAIRAIEAVHTVRGSGSMNIAYPPQWEGMVHLSTYGMGSIGASGNGLVVRKESSRELYGYRGATQGRKVEISELGNGSVKFSC